jgi:CRISPR-associated protein Csm5
MEILMKTQYEITLLSPVHIGSGDKLSKNIDYFSDETGTYLVDSDKFFETLTPAQIDELTNSRDIIEFMERNRINKKDFVKKKISPQQVAASEINQCIKSSFENPYIPGSSLKGALRTVIGWHLFKELNISFDFNPRSKKEWAYNNLSNEIFGKDPNHDFLKGFIVVDSPFDVSDVTLHLTKVYTMRRNNILSVKLTQRDNPGSEMQIYAEFLKEKSSSGLRIKIDDFLFTPRIMEKLGIDKSRKQVLLKLGQIAKDYAREKIEKELNFFAGQDKLNAVTQFYKDLLKKLEPLDEHSFILNLGWGTGWKFKTGDYIDESDLDRVRRAFDLGTIIKECPFNHKGRDLKDNKHRKIVFCYKCRKEYPYEEIKQVVKPFPKSRKIVFDSQGNPFGVPGWVRLTKV